MSAPNEYPDQVSKEEWFKKLDLMHIPRLEMNSLIMNYLVREGFEEVAEQFQKESGLSPPKNFNAIKNRIQIRQEIQNGRTEEATRLVNALHPELLDMDKSLNYQLQRLHLVELIRNDKIEEAVQFAQSQLSEYGRTDQVILNELERTLALIAFEHPLNSPFRDVLDMEQRYKVASAVNAALLKAEFSDATSNQLQLLIKLIHWCQHKLTAKNVGFMEVLDWPKAETRESSSSSSSPSPPPSPSPSKSPSPSMDSE